MTAKSRFPPWFGLAWRWTSASSSSSPSPPPPLIAKGRNCWSMLRTPTTIKVDEGSFRSGNGICLTVTIGVAAQMQTDRQTNKQTNKQTNTLREVSG
ncbi:hypothetical protein LX32DRAFT_14909 [Colletotrichum zoysiae]|uniref:Uncharacterized protein n=1 Tax=Colletotrichum zoysiae TaxID=1216348 RepID=A0AAD9LY35_9PEZI|nr:hypothetical protein LX32DRAFT_14909 [Colletotrichum zoysiae]